MENRMKLRLNPHLVSCLFLAATAMACSETDTVEDAATDAAVDGGGVSVESPYEPDHLVEVEIEMDADDWQALRNEGRSLPMALTYCEETEFEYTYFGARVTVDGVPIEDAGIRKKGYLGSITPLRPSFKVNFGTFVNGQTLSGMRRMTLNNDRQDPSHTHQCISYALFRAAGVTAPRCNHAHVVVNGEDLGLYSHVESIKKPFLRRHFDDDGGNLYEFRRADFTDEAIPYVEIKTNEPENDRSDLKEIVEALKASDAGLYDALDEIIDVDAFLTYWAMEVITGHWDGATGNSNNHYMYRDPTTDRFYFIPWGTDGALTRGHVLLDLALMAYGMKVPDSVYAMARIPHRLYGYSKTRALYHERLRELLDEVWDDEALLAEVDRIGELTGADPDALEKARTFVRSRRPSIEVELADGVGPDWPVPPETYPSGDAQECSPPTPVSGTFKTTWGDLGNLQPGPDNRLEITVSGEKLTMGMTLTAAGTSNDPRATMGIPNIHVIGVPTSGDPKLVIVNLTFEEPSLFRAGEVPFHGFETFAPVLKSKDMMGNLLAMLGFVGGGKIVLDKAGTNPGDPVEGRFEGLFAQVYRDVELPGE
jgi:hypothetical protein